MATINNGTELVCTIVGFEGNPTKTLVETVLEFNFPEIVVSVTHVGGFVYRVSHHNFAEAERLFKETMTSVCNLPPCS
jgi:hypothetical protein